MLSRADIRFSATSAATASAGSLVLPLLVVARQPTTQQALAAARQVVEAFGAMAAAARIPGGHLALADPSSAATEADAGAFAIQQRSAKEAQVEVVVAAVLTIDEPATFWSRAQVIAWATDLVQAFGARPWPKGVWVLPKRGRFPTEPRDANEAAPDVPE